MSFYQDMFEESNIETIEFGVSSDDERKKIAVYEVTSAKSEGTGTVYDRRGGYIPGISEEECCVTCGETRDCPGHFGFIQLMVPVIHPMYYKDVSSFLKCFCKVCHRLLVTKEQIELDGLMKYKNENRFNKILEKISKVDTCSRKDCCTPQAKVVYKSKDKIIALEYKQKKSEDGETGKLSIVLTVEEIKKIFDNIPDEDVRLLGFNPERIHPRNFIMSVFPVPPPAARPPVLSDGNLCDDDLTYQIIEIAKNNISLQELLEETKKENNKNKQKLEQKIEQKTQSIKFRIATTYINKGGKAKHPTDNRPIKCIKSRLAGKGGQLRSNHMGKRVNFSARTVIGAGVHKKLCQLGVPKIICKKLTVPEKVTKYNKEWLTEIVNNGEANSIIKIDGKVKNYAYYGYSRGTELLYGDIIVRGDYNLEKDENNQIIIPEDCTGTVCRKIKKDGTYLIQAGLRIVRKKKNRLVNKPTKYNLKAGTFVVSTDVEVVKNDNGVYEIIEKPPVEIIRVLGNVNKPVLKEGDQLVRNGDLVQVIYPKKKVIELEIGETVERQLRGPEKRYGKHFKGDIVLFNRQPTLHNNSMQAMECVPVDGKTYIFNLATTKGFNADFDGDEMNIHVAQSYETRKELQYSEPIENIISAQESKNIVTIVQDNLLSGFLMSNNNKISREEFMEIASRGEKVDGSPLWDPKKIKSIQQTLKMNGKKPEVFNGRGLISLLLPDDLNYDNKNDADEKEPVVKIRRGVFLEGKFDKSVLGSSYNSLILILNKEYGKEVAGNFIDNIQFITNQWMLSHGFSVGLEDCMITSEESVSSIKEALAKSYAKAQGVEETTINPDIREARVMGALSQAKDIGMSIATKAMKPDNNFLSTVKSGAKGDFFNIAQITGLLGQQCLESGRVKPTLNNGKRTLPHYPFGAMDKERDYESKGMIRHSFIRGLEPEEFWFHAMAGREGIISTAMKTANSGYTQRRIIKIQEDVMVQYDGTVRDATGKILQMHYGGSGFDPKKTVRVNNSPQICDISRLVDKLNTQYENGLGDPKQILIEQIKKKCPSTIIDDDWTIEELSQRLEAIIQEEQDIEDNYDENVLDNIKIQDDDDEEEVQGNPEEEVSDDDDEEQDDEEQDDEEQDDEDDFDDGLDFGFAEEED